MTWRPNKHLVLAFYPTTSGYAFVLFEGPDAPFDWGVVEVRTGDKNERTIDSLRRLLGRYHPDVVAIEDVSTTRPRRCPRIRRLYQRIEHAVISDGVELFRCPRNEVRSTFVEAGAVTKHEIAEAIADMIPAFAHRLPPRRKIWMSEDPRQGLFDAAALGIAYFAHTDLGEDDADACARDGR